MISFHIPGLENPPRDIWDSDDNKLQRNDHTFISDGSTTTRDSLTKSFHDTSLESHREYLLAHIWKNPSPRDPWGNDDYKLQRNDHTYTSDGSATTRDSLTKYFRDTSLESHREYLLAHIRKNPSPRDPWGNDDYKLQRNDHTYTGDGSTSTRDSLTNSFYDTSLETHHDHIWQNVSNPFPSMSISKLSSQNSSGPHTFNGDYTRNGMPINMIQPKSPRTSTFLNDLSLRTFQRQQRVLSLCPNQTVAFPFNNIGPVPLRRPEDYFTYPQFPTHIHYQLVTYFVEGRNKNGNPETELLTTEITHPSGNPCQVNIQVDSGAPYRYICSFHASEVGVYTGYVHFPEKQNINGSPFKLFVTRNYCNSKAKIIAGVQQRRNGSTSKVREAPANLWGIDVDRFSEKIYVCDKASHKIQIFTCEGIPLAEFGEQGCGQNQFNKPTGVAVDQTNKRIIVSDKDNHRICCLTLDGTFINTFGRVGHKDGEFTYPWGIGVSPNGELIAVADSRNHRIQLFDKNGNFLRKYTVFETNPFDYKTEFDYPRGICFDNTGKHIYVSDFNLHTVIMLNIELTEKSVLVPPGKLYRPQGIVVDIAGNILICDSRNNCIPVVSPRGVLLYNIKGNGSRFDGPQDLSILPGGLLSILDSKGVVRVY